MPDPISPTILVVFGATGDLMARKIVPSIFHLRSKGALPEHFACVGVSRRPWSDDDLRGRVKDIVAERYPDADADSTEEFGGMFTYSQGAFADEAAYEALAKHLRVIDSQWGVCANKLFYLAVPPEHYETIFRRLAASGLTEPCDDLTGWTRVLVEKPFGSDADSSRELDELLASLFHEEQIYRIDHYLAKEMLQGILNFRFTNNLFETAWDRTAIESIDIVLHETIGVEKRGLFYDGVGALRDVGQNHLLQMLALVTMEQPAAEGAAAIRKERARTIREVLQPPTASEVALRTYRSQYDGFRQIEGVDPDSGTETFFRMRTELHGPRWAGVPVTLESGKRMDTVCKQIAVTFRHPHPCMCSGGRHYQNRVIFNLEPRDEIKIEFWAKKPGFDNELEMREFRFFLYEREEKAQYVEEYARLLLDGFRGDQTLFVSTDEVRAMWEFIDPVVQAWDAGAVPLDTYTPDTHEAAEAALVQVAKRAASGAVGIVGLGKMGAGIALNLRDHDWIVTGYNRSPEKTQALAAKGIRPAASLRELVESLPTPRIVWLMLTAGAPIDAALFDPDGLAALLSPGDIVIDGGNSYYKDAQGRADRLAQNGIRFLDCGTSGGPGGARSGACLMIGGREEDFRTVEPLFADLALHDGYRFFDGHGAGHFVKMVHNGIEYGMMQAIAEGFQIMHRSPLNLDLERVAEVYQRGSVIESRLVGWMLDAIRELGPDLEGVSGSVGHTGEGEWTIRTAEEMSLEDRVIRAAFEFRVDSERDPSYAGQVLSALRNRFGGHAM
ncbi:MAG: glucose-6-phosphate dehydrogenase [Actinomycetota bacterium]|nr:glucose-6-phosphate dehydrogenase [Actinomycetota bacterium]